MSRRTKLTRSDSLSTIGTNHDIETGAYKVVINQGDREPRQTGAPNLPSIGVDIPHYRLGMPRFSARGTAFLHSAVYSRTSEADDQESSVISGAEIDRVFPVPPGMESHTNISQPRSHSPPESQPQPVRTPTNAPMRMPITTVAPVFHRAREPIVPGIYDAIAMNPDDPAIVRYAMSTREISAASPARLIAQVTSKNFLDYELLSDFFLTVRAYLSTHDLLAYLLTRFEWAINRFDDDGRVIRVRAFAAIRHWILNYFPYDFVVDRDLRVRFCEHLNALSRHVRLRASYESSSDLKLIIDLKKCWHGRCALYWDNIHGENGRNDVDIYPGGIVGSRDSQLTHPSELWAKLATTSSHQLDQERSVAALHNWVDSVIEAEVDGKSKADQQANAAVPSHHSTSLLSEQSIQAMSCTPPAKTIKAFATQANRSVGPHPVPAVIPPTVRKACPPAPSAQTNGKPSRAKQDHQRSGSLSNALQDKRASLGAIQEGQPKENAVMNLAFSGSLIRGSVLPPGSPFIDNLMRHQGSASSLQKEGQYTGVDDNRLAARPMSPGVKNLLGTIRRAWGSKPNSAAATPNLLTTAPFMVETKSSTLPMHIAFKIEGLGDQHHQLEALKKNARIDLLCADVTEMFERIMIQEQKGEAAPETAPEIAPINDIGVASGNEREQPSPEVRESMTSSQRQVLTRNHSEVTTGSRSIVIVDDTSSEPPVPNIPREYSAVVDQTDTYNTTHALLSATGQSTPPLSAAFQPLIPAQTPCSRTQDEGHTPYSDLLPEFTIPVSATSPTDQQNPQMSGAITSPTTSQRARPSFATGKSFKSNRSGSTSLRKYASYQSGMRRSGPDHSIGATNVLHSPPGSSKGQSDKPPGRMLRRRPGGDLKANQNVHDLEPIPRPRSTGSITTYTESAHNSLAFLKSTVANSPSMKSSRATGPASTHPGSAPKKSLSLVRSSSSHQERRPSFELAVAEFARIPDDEGGDLEATLLKLEGKFRKSPVGSSEGRPPTRGGFAESRAPEEPTMDSKMPRLQAPEQEVGSQNGMLIPNASLEKAPKDDLEGTDASNERRGTMTRSLYAESEESYNEVPLLERAFTNRSEQRDKAVSDQSNVTVPQPLFSPSHTADKDPLEDGSLGSGFEGSERIRRGRYRSSIPTMTTDSFLLDEDEFLSDLSSELSDDDEETNSVLEDAFGSAAAAHHLRGPTLPANVGYASGYLPSPPMTTENAMAMTAEANRIQDARKPPTPEPSPVSRITESSKSRTPTQVDGSVLQPFANKVHQFPPRRHIPFVLAFDPAVLAQQFTIVERDALNEINWQDLIDMRWQQTSPSALNWVEYLRYQDPNGIDLVTARFNIVVKWALSQIVLTHNTEERALTIMKYIHIAQFARKYHNYATLLQLTIALTSIDCTRLTKTWALVPESERTSMKEMESLVSPLRNFHNLRAEMEAADLDDGCIPVVGTFPAVSFLLIRGTF